MIILGSILANIDIKNALKDISIYYGTFIKLIVIPGVIILFSKIIGDNSIVMKTLILIQAMPAAAMTVIFSENFKLEEEYSALIVFITTLFSLITIPIIIKIIL